MKIKLQTRYFGLKEIRWMSVLLGLSKDLFLCKHAKVNIFTKMEGKIIQPDRQMEREIQSGKNIWFFFNLK